MTNEAIVIGWINKGKPADCGETMKNQLMIHRLEELGVKCRCVDFKNWRRHPWVFLQLIWNLVIHKKDTIIFSTSTVNVYPMMKLMKKVKWKQPTIHWVIGGTLGEKVKNGIFDKDIIGYMDWTIVESNLMVQQLTDCGVKNVFQLPNFKPITYYPNIKERINEWKKEITRPLRFVFLSRIMKEKGVDELFRASKKLKEIYHDKIEIGMVGFFEDEYKEKVEHLEQEGIIRFYGFQNEVRPFYEKAHCIVLPSYHEGMSNVLLEAASTGRALITTYIPGCKEAVDEGINGYLCKVKSAKSLYRKMHQFIELTKKEREEMGKNGRRKMQAQFDKDKVVEKTVKAILS